MATLMHNMNKDKLTVKIYPATKAMANEAAKEVFSCIRKKLKEKEFVNIIFAAAPSQADFLSALAACDIEWRRINAFHMDEYIELPDDAPQLFGNFLRRYLFDLVPFHQTFFLNGWGDADQECMRYAALLAEYPVDIVCLGIGENGHIAFNDPHVADFKDSRRIKVVRLDDVCRQQQVNDHCFDRIEEVPRYALTLTIPALLSAPCLYCVVPFRSKAQAVYNTLNGEISENCPASVLRTKENAILYLDPESSSLLNL
ncbi:MAG: glucosamine-6-phosphate deaminase [Tannerellaceae bacterium]|jgi:glucosamine-6-phosphate deaminase|nr:glucosamine-6-phosphate deaminase [Tannerellaceae bacterium]